MMIGIKVSLGFLDSFSAPYGTTTLNTNFVHFVQKEMLRQENKEQRNYLKKPKLKDIKLLQKNITYDIK